MALMRIKPGPKPQPRGPNARPKTQREKDEFARIACEKALDDCRKGISELTPSQLKAIELRYSRLRPLLSSIEQIQQDPRDIQEER